METKSFLDTYGPRITFSDKATTPLQVASQQIHVLVTLPLVKVTTTLTFENKHGKILEGELVFPLPEQASLIGYALDVDGQLVDAVPVEKEKAKLIFEEEVRSRKKGAAIVEMATSETQSNSFRTRVYPLHPNRKRMIRVVYQMPVTQIKDKSEVQLPLAIPSPDSKLDVQWQWHQSTEYRLELFWIDSKNGKKEPFLQGKKLISQSNEYQLFEFNQGDLVHTEGVLVVSSNQVQQDEYVVVEDNYFCIRTKVTVPEDENENLSTDFIQILWDSSFSRADQQQRDCALLRKIIEQLQPNNVLFTQFSNNVLDKGTLFRNNYSQLFDHVENKVVYDGATNLCLLESLLDERASFVVLFTDGIHTAGKPISPEIIYHKPMYIICSSSSCNSQLLNHIANKSGGKFINGALQDVEQVVKQVGKASLYFIVADYEEEEFEEVYPNEPVVLQQEYFDLYGKVKQGGEIAISFRYGSNIAKVQVVQVIPSINSKNNSEATESKKHSDKIIPMLWAQQKMRSLSAFPQLFEKELKEIGQEWSIVTPNTSLLVLEELTQYVKHKIVPPISLPEVRKSYFEKLQKDEKEKQDKREKKIKQILSLWQARVSWHKIEDKPKILDDSEESESQEEEFADGSRNSIISREVAPRSSIASLSSSAHREMGGFAASMHLPASPAIVIPSSILQESSTSRISDKIKEKREVEDSTTINREIIGGMKKKRFQMSFNRSVNFNRSINTADTDINDREASGSIQVQKWTSNASYMPSIKTSNNPYECYLEQRKNFKTSPGFYLDIADYWLTELKQSDVGIRILTNILELELENVQLLRIVGYRLDQEKEYELAEIIFEKVKRLSPSEPQSYRDLALIKEKMGKYEEAVQLFNEVITGQWASRFDEIELTAIIELNHCLEKAQLPDLKPVDEGFRYKMDLDLRISLAWDTNDTDIDLHVYEEVPRGQHCYFGNRYTAIGGLLSRDFTRGYGPEEYMLRKAPAGKYRVTNKYFSSHQQSLTGGTTILCTFFTNYMRPNEKRECVTMRLSSNKEEQHVCTINIDN